MLSLNEKIKAIANELYEQRSLLVMGRGFNYATCLEGALVSLQKCHHKTSLFNLYREIVF